MERLAISAKFEAKERHAGRKAGRRSTPDEWGWINERGPDQACPRAGWCHLHVAGVDCKSLIEM